MKRALSSATLLFVCLTTAACALEESTGPGGTADDSSLSRPPTATQTAAGEASVLDGGAPSAVAANCGDGVCTPYAEDCGNCLIDCPCWQAGTVCSAGQCVISTPECDLNDICCRKPWLPF